MSDGETKVHSSPEAARSPSAELVPQAGSGTGAEPDLVGTVLGGRYRILRKLGGGAMGEVYVGEHLKIGRRDAIKVLRGPLASDPEAIARFNRGARNVAAVQHPNVCTIYDYSDTDDGIPFLAMEFIEGESLKELLDREGPLPVGRAARIARQVADALHAAHGQGIVHRDLKPANVMLMLRRDGADEVRVVDFDIAKGSQEGEDGEVTRMGFVIGTPEYMSPEQLMAERLDGRSDVYSLGILLFRMLTGALPFQGESPHEIVFQRLTNPPLQLAEAMPGGSFPPALQSVLDRALQRSPADRYPSAAEFARELLDAVSDVEDAPRIDEIRLTATGIIPASKPERRSHDELPETRVSKHEPGGAAASSGGRRDGGEPAANGAGRRAGMLVGTVAAVSVVGLGIAWFAINRGSAPNPLATGQDPRVAGVVRQSSAEGNPGTTLYSDVLTDMPQPSSTADEPRETSRPSSPQAEEPAPATGAKPALPQPPTEVAGGVRERTTTLPAAESSELARSVVSRQFRSVVPNLSDREYIARRDTSSRYFERQDLPSDLRARAAFVVALTWKEQGNTDQCRRWARIALDLHERSGYRLIYQACGG